MNEIICRIGVQAACRTAMTLYPLPDAAVDAVARELCMPVEAVEEAIRPVALES
jgi:hypothetical protein